MSSKGLVIPTIGNILVVIAIILLTLTGLLGGSFEIESTQKSGLTLSLENSAYLWTGALEQSTQIIAMRSAYDIAKTGGINGGEIATWYVNGPDVMDLKAHLEELIAERLPSGSLAIGNSVSFDEGYVDISGYDASCGPIADSKCFHISAEKTFSIADGTIKASVNQNPYRYNLDAKSNYFSLLYAGRAIMEEEQFSSLLGSVSSLKSAFLNDPRFSGLKIETSVSGSIIEFSLWDESCIGTDSYYCLTPLTADEEGITVEGKQIPYDFTRLKFRVDTQNLNAPPTLRYIFRVKEGYGKVCATKDESALCTIGSRQVRFEENEEIHVNALPREDFVKFVGIWNSQQITISTKDDTSIPLPSSPPAFPAQYDGAFVDGYFKTCQPVTCLPGSCGPISNGCGRTINCGSCGGGNWWCDYDVSICKCTPFTCQEKGMECGPLYDGCSETLNCGYCTGQDICISGKCVCQPNCNGKSCGPDGCGGSCGSCSGKKEMTGSTTCTNGVLKGQVKECTLACTSSGTCDCTLPSTWSEGKTIRTCTYGCDGSKCKQGYYCQPATASCRIGAGGSCDGCSSNGCCDDPDNWWSTGQDTCSKTYTGGCYASIPTGILATVTCTYAGWKGTSVVVADCNACKHVTNPETACSGWHPGCQGYQGSNGVNPVNYCEKTACALSSNCI